MLFWQCEGLWNTVEWVAISANGWGLVSGSVVFKERICEAQNGGMKGTLEGHSAHVYSVAISADGSRIVSGSDDKTVKIWDVHSGELKATLEGHSGYV